jgi:hypothetical protein
MSHPAAPPARLHPLASVAPAIAALLCVAAALAPPGARAAEPDYSGYQALLRQYVHLIGAKGEPMDSRFDYEQLYIDEGYHRTRRAERLETIHTQLVAVRPSEMSERERVAWAINVHNFLAIQRMTVNLLVPRRGTMRHDSPKHVRADDGAFFAAQVAVIEGRPYSLGGIERRFAYGDTTADPLADGLASRLLPGDPRLQFALCKAALASGLILPWVYRADSLDAQLDRATRLSLALPRWILLDEATGSFRASNRFFDERVDHGGVDMPGLVPFLARHGPPALKKAIRKGRQTKPSMYFEPNWKLNQYDHPREALPGETRDSTRAK